MATDNYGGAGGNPAFSVSNGMYDQQTVQRYIDFYKKDPKAFNSAQKETLRGYAHYYNLPFALNDEDQEFNIARALRNVGEGFIEGFTTVHIGKKPTHPVDRIARSIGSLAGFVGFIPGVPQFKGLSLPMLGAKFSTKQATKFAGKITKAGGLLKSGALKSSIDFLSKPITADILEGAFFRGSASAISSWEGGVDEMMKGFAWGATTGGIDRAIGNLITVGDPDGLARKAVKSIASSIAQGAPMTAMGAPKEEQIYEYLLGGYFGWSEPSYIDKASQKNIFDIANKMRYSNPFIEPKDLKGWKDLPDAVKARTNELYEKEFGTLDQNAILNNEMMKRIGETPEEVKVQYEEIVKKLYGDEGIPEEDKGLSVVALNQKLIDMDEKPIEGLEQLWSTEGQDKLEQSVLNWTGKNLEHIYNVGDDSNENNNRRIKLAVNIQNYWRDITAGDNKKIPQGIEMIKFLENKENNFDIPVLSEEQQAWWINKGLQKAYRENVPTASIEISDNVTGEARLTDGTKIILEHGAAKLKFHPGKTILASGEDKTKREPPKFIEHVYETEKLKYAPDKKERIPRNILDVSFVTNRSSQTGLIEAKKLADYSEGLKYKKDAMDMDAIFDQVSEQFDKEGFYYYGGKGDNQTWTFMKYHPAIADMSIAQIKQEANALYNEGIKAGVIDRKTFVEDMKQWNTTKDKSKGYLKGLVSNARYELAMNGLDDEGYSSLFSDGNWVNSAKAFNKRSQIWFTSGYEYDSKMFDHIVSTDKDVEWNNYKEIDGKMEPVLKYVISTGAEGVYDQKLLSDKSLASMHEQGLDGAIMVLPERLDVVNRTGGMLTSGKKNKSFIISKGEKRTLQDGSEENLGTLLGKYMFHIAPPEEAADLRKKGLDMIVYTTAAKQYGRRKAYHAKYSPDTGEIDFLNTKDKNNIFKENEIEGYDLPLKDIKNVLTERTDLHNKVSDWASLPKQMLTNPSEYVYGAKSDEDIVRYRDTIKNMQEELVGRAIDGDDTINRLADEYMADPSNPKKMKELVNNLDKLSLTRLMQMFNKDGLEEFSFLAFNKISRQNKEFVEDLIASGEHTKDTYYDFMQNMLDESSAVGKHQSLDKGTGGSLTHKFNINYVNDVLNSYIANRATRPKTGNAFAFRMSPYFDSLHHRKNPEGETYQLNRDIIEKGSQLSRLYGDGHKGEDFFFFNDGHKDLEIMFLGNKRKLGDIWSEFIKKSNESGTTIEDLKPYHDLLEAIVLRVPMDSNSGAQVLKFGGFTGTEGGGSLIHPRKMELLGGADLDGDKDFVFFGGRGEAGERGEHREGFRNSWKQYFKEQADEFYEYRNTKTGETMPIDEYSSIGSIAKKTTPQQLSKSDKEAVDWKNSLLSSIKPTTKEENWEKSLLTSLLYPDDDSNGRKNATQIDEYNWLVKEPVAAKISPEEEIHLKGVRGFVSDEKYGLPEKLSGSYLHGTQDTRIEINKDGDLILKPSTNFGGKTKGLSFTELRDVAKFYGEHRGGKKRKVVPGTVLIKINKKALPSLKQESVEEAFLKTDKNIKIKKGDFTLHSSTKPKDVSLMDSIEVFDTNTVSYRQTKNGWFVDEKEFLENPYAVEKRPPSLELMKAIGSHPLKEVYDSISFKKGQKPSFEQFKKAVVSEWEEPIKKKIAKFGARKLVSNLEFLVKQDEYTNQEIDARAVKSGSLDEAIQDKLGVYPYRAVEMRETIKRIRSLIQTKGEKVFAEEIEGVSDEGTAKEFIKNWKLTARGKTQVKTNQGNLPVDKSDWVKVQKHNKDAIDPETGKAFKDHFVETDKNITDKMNNSFLRLSPNQRLQASKGAYEGRPKLGTAVNTRSFISAYYSLLRKHGGERVESGEGNILITPKTDNASLSRFSSLARAAIAVTSDPMDEAGIKDRSVFFNVMFKSLFNVKQTDGSNLSTEDMLKIASKGKYNDIKNVNNLFYGKDSFTGRGFTPLQKANKLKDIRISSDETSTFLPRLYNSLKHVKGGINPLEKLNLSGMTNTIDKINKGLDDPQMDSLRKIMKRASLSSGLSDQLKMIATEKPYLLKNYEAIVSGEKNIQKYLAKGLKYSADDLDDPRWRAWQLDKVIKQANDFITNGLTDLAFISSSPKYLDSLRKAFPGDSEKDFGNRVEGILKFADSLKSASWLRKYSEKGANEELSPKLAFMKQELKDKGLDGSNIKEGMDKYEIDDTIRKFKKTHSPEENNLLDLFLLSSYGEGTGMSSRTKKKRIKEIEESRLSNKSKRDKIIEVEKEFKKNVTTNVSRLAYSSDAVNLRVMGDFQDTYNSIYKGFTNKPPEKIVKLAQKVGAEAENVIKVFNKSFTKVNPFDFVEASQVESYVGKEYLEHYIGLTKSDGKRTFFKEGKLTDEQAKLSNNINKLLTHFMPSSVGRDIRGFFKDVTNKPANAMNMEDWRTVERFLESMKPGWIEKYLVPDVINEKGENVGLGLTSWVWKMFPTALNRQLMRKGAKLKERDNWYLTPFGKVLGKTHTPTHFIDGGQEWVHRTEQATVGLHDKLTREFYKELSPFIGITDEDNNDVGLRIYRSAIAEREGSPQALAMLKNLYKDRGDVEDIVETYKGRSVGIFVENKWDDLKRKEFNVKTGEGKVERLTGEQIAKRINNVVTDRVKQMNELQQGKEGALDKFIVKDEKGNPETYTDGTPIFNFDKNKRSGAEPILAHIEEFINTYKDIPTDIGIYGWQLISKSHNLKRLGDQLFELKVKINEFKPLTSAESKKEYKRLTDKYTKMLKAHKLYMSIKITPPGALPFDFYFPHINSENLKMSTAEFKKSLAKTTKLPPEEQEGAVKNLLDAFHRMNGNYEDIETLKLSVGEKVIDKYLLDKVDFDEKTDTDIKWLDRITKSAHQKKREAHLGGWSVEPEVMANYFERLSSTYFKNIATIATRNNLFDFEDDIADAYGKWDEGIKQNWVNLYKLYIQKALGNPAVIPEYMLENEGMAFRGSLYAGWSDGHVAKTIDNVFTKLGLKKHLLPEEYQSLEKMTPQDVIRWSNIEAKYQVATLLAHPKASINNIYGGTTHTGISAGWRNLSKAKQFEYVRNAINPEWKGWDDVNVWLTEIGIHEDFMRSELNVNPAFKNAKWRKAGSEIIDILVKNPDAEKSTLSAVLKKHGIVDSAFNAAAWFMHRPERMIRRDAFLAHYFNALEHLGGAVSDPMTNPYLLRMAEKGVKATQFLYSNAHRPMFAAPALGKVMNRFQLFSWNSIRFRNDIRRQAKIHGYKPGSPEFSRYKRLVTTDMLSLALANAFAYSLFDTALPPPLNWLQDFADWIFGEKKERERAFYGTYPGAIAPLQLFTPPIARMIVPTINAMIDDDYSKLANYHTWTMFPFGRIAKTGFDTFKNPIMLPDKATGIPFMGMSKYNKQLQSYNVRARGILNTISEKKNKE